MLRKASSWRTSESNEGLLQVEGADVNGAGWAGGHKAGALPAAGHRGC